MSKEEIRELCKNYQNDIIDSLRDILQYNSIQADPKPGQPFGEEVDKCLNKTLEIAESLGFKTGNIDGYAGYAEIGEGEEMFGILCHLDIVPAGDDWSYPPFAGKIDDNKIYGRGTLDNKGPAIASLYAMKVIQDLDIKLNKRVRLIFGCNEESGWAGIDYYKKHAEMPEIAFSPDAEFPVIHAEKGILIFNLNKDLEAEPESDLEPGRVTVKSITGGNAPNMVPDRARAIVEGEFDYLSTQLEKYNNSWDGELQLTKTDKGLELEARGISAHGSMPQDGVNAVSHLINFLVEIDITPDEKAEFLKQYSELIGLNYFGENIGCQDSDEVSGPLVFNVGQIQLDDEQAKVVVNIRYPVQSNAAEVFSGIEARLESTGWTIEKGEHKEPLFVEKDSELVKSLMEIYQEETGDYEAAPIAIGGGTYARAVEKAVAFGPLFPGQPELAHQKDEYIGVDDLIKNTVIYAKAIAALAGN
ncbi:MAG: dipeptidase PepV [Halarsenatibacteraceae bacterium]